MIVLWVQFTVKPGSEGEAREILHTMQEHTRREPGCRQYVGHQSTENPQQFMFYEVYDDRAAVDAHRAAPYFKEYIEGRLEQILESRTRHFYSPVE
jgi:quinol monooxygenase YgiN